MSHGIAVKGLDKAGGTQLAGSQNTFRINGQPVVLLGDRVEPHQNGKHNSNPKMVEGSKILKYNGVPVVIEGNKASCGHATTGQSKFRVSR